MQQLEPNWTKKNHHNTPENDNITHQQNKKLTL